MTTMETQIYDDLWRPPWILSTRLDVESVEHPRTCSPPPRHFPLQRLTSSAAEGLRIWIPMGCSFHGFHGNSNGFSIEFMGNWMAFDSWIDDNWYDFMGIPMAFDHFMKPGLLEIWWSELGRCEMSSPSESELGSVPLINATLKQSNRLGRVWLDQNLNQTTKMLSDLTIFSKPSAPQGLIKTTNGKNQVALFICRHISCFLYLVLNW